MRYVTLAERPDLVTAMWRMGNDWPEFMLHDPWGDAFFGRLPEVFPQWQQLLLDDDGAVVGKVNAIPFPWDGTDDDLPDRGWGAVMERGFTAQRRGIPATAVSLLEARLVARPARRRPLAADARGDGGAGGRGRAARPVRPGAADPQARGAVCRRWPTTPSRPGTTGCRPTRGSGCTCAWAGGSSRWRRARWSSRGPCGSGASGRACRSTRPGDVVVPFACNPVHVSLEQDHAVYVEPNVWVHHDLRTGGP